MQICSAGAEPLRAEEQAHGQAEEWTDGYDMAFRNFANTSKIRRQTQTVYLCILCVSERLFPYTALTDWFLYTEI
jgi:hypothetical protein